MPVDVYKLKPLITYMYMTSENNIYKSSAHSYTRMYYGSETVVRIAGEQSIGCSISGNGLTLHVHSPDGGTFLCENVMTAILKVWHQI